MIITKDEAFEIKLSRRELEYLKTVVGETTDEDDERLGFKDVAAQVWEALTNAL